MIIETIRFPLHVRALLFAVRVALVLLGVVGYALDAAKRGAARVWRWVPVLALVGELAASAGPVAGLTACSGPMSATVGGILDGLDVAACTAATAAAIAIPIPGAPALVGFACATEEAAVSAAIAKAEQQAPAATIPPPDAGAPLVPLALHLGGGTERGAPLYRGTGAARHEVGACPCGWPPGKVALAQAALDAQQDGGR